MIRIDLFNILIQLHFLVVLNVTSFRDAETGQIKTKMGGWNVPDVTSATIVNASVYHSEKFFDICMTVLLTS